MPLHLEPVDVSNELDGLDSALIVSCPICPPVSLAMQNDPPVIEFFKHGIKTEAFEDYIGRTRESLESRGIRTGVCTMYLPDPMMCLWTEGQHRRMRKRAKGYAAVVVLGCESAKVSVERALDGMACRVLLAMELTGLTNAVAKARLPLTIDLAQKQLVE